MAYVVPIHRPSSVRHALKLRFLNPNEEALIVAKSNQLEIYKQTADGLVQVHLRSVYGYITMLERLRPSASSTDHLFVGTDRYQYFTVLWDDVRREIRTEQSYLDQADKVLRDSAEADRCHVDPSLRFMTLELYDGVVTVVPLEQATDGRASAQRRAATKQEDSRILGSPIQIRIEELRTRSSAFLDVEPGSRQKPRLAILWDDNEDIPQIKVRELEYFPDAAGDQAFGELKTMAEFRGHLDLGVSHLIPVSHPYGGFLVLGERSITYVTSDLKNSISRDLDEDATFWSAWEKVDDQRWLLADDFGRLYLLMILIDSGRVHGWRSELVGTISKASTLVYLDGGHVFVGSHSGDSQVIKIEESGSTVVKTFQNIAPILDFTIMDLGRGFEGRPVAEFSSGQARLVTASGAWQDGSLRSVRSGVGIEELGSLGEISHITDMWSLSSHGNPDVQDTLLVTFVDETRVFKFDSEASIEEVDHFCGFELSETTLLASNLSDHRILQVSETRVQMTDLESGMTISSWRPSSDCKITATACNEECLVVISGGSTFEVFDLSQKFDAVSSKKFPAESQIASVTIPSAPTSICIVAFWQSASIAIVALDSLEPIHSQKLGRADTAIPRSVLIANILPEAPPTLFVAMADGTVVTYSLDTGKNELNHMTRLVLGSEPVTFKKLPRKASEGPLSTESNVFASCEQPSLVYAFEGRIIFAAVNSDKASRVCFFSSVAYPGAVAVATPNELKLALIDTERTTQLTTLSIGETVRCVTYSRGLQMFGLGCIRRILESGAEAWLSSFKIADEVTFKELDTVELKDGELIQCVIELPARSDEEGPHGDMFVVGTGILDDTAETSVRGRILVYEVYKKQKLMEVTELPVKGACQSLAMCDQNIVVGLAKTVVMYKLVPDPYTPDNLVLAKLAAFRTATMPLALSATPSTKTSAPLVAVADLLKSVSILELGRASTTTSFYSTLTESARHFATVWTNSVCVLGDNEWVVADTNGNLIVVRRNIKGVTDDDRKRLEVTSELHLGEVVNTIVPVPTSASVGSSFSARDSSTITNSNGPPDTAAGPIVVPKAFLATVEGGVYMLGTIGDSYQDLLMRLQQAVAARIKGLGYMPWNTYRAFKNQVREADEPFRFVDGELVEEFLNLSAEEMAQVVSELGGENNVERIKGLVDGLKRFH